MNGILSTVMMNASALQLMNLLLRGSLIDPASVAAGTFLAIGSLSATPTLRGPRTRSNPWR